MKTTVEIPDALLAAARQVAARYGLTLPQLVEKGLRRVVPATAGKTSRSGLRSLSWAGRAESAGGMRT